MISEKNNVLLNISENLTDLQQKLEQEKVKISEEMVKQRKTIHRLKLRNSQLRAYRTKTRVLGALLQRYIASETQKGSSQ